MRPWLSMERGAVGLLGLVLAAGCQNDDDAGGGSISGGGTQPTTMTTGSTTDVTPTTSVSATMSSETDSTTTTGVTTVEETTMVEPPPPLLVDCGAPPKGAVGADYFHQASASGGVPSYQWSASGLPDGLSITPNLGEIEGTPTTAGDYMVTITVEDSEGQTAMADCPVITIGDKLGVDYDALEGDGPCIVAGGKTIIDYLTGGDGSPVTCAVPGGVGDGKLPAGLAVDPATCAITGAITETRYGGWAWIVTAEQNGVKVHAPYCATQSQQAAKAYAIVGSHSGGVDNELTPLLQKVDVMQPLRFDGDADPLFEVNKETCGQSCFFGYMYRVSQSPFGSGDCKSDKDGCFGLCPLVPDQNQPDGDTLVQCPLLPKMGTPKTGFAHEMWAKGEVPTQEFTTRPFIIQWSIDYCLSNVQADCQGKDAILANGDGSNLEFPVIFRPQ
jgi:hypothetical protein